MGPPGKPPSIFRRGLTLSSWDVFQCDDFGVVDEPVDHRGGDLCRAKTRS